MPYATTWNLDDLYPIEEFEARVNNIKSLIACIPERVKTLHPAMDKKSFGEYILFIEQIQDDLSVLGSRAMLAQSSDQKSEIARSHVGIATDLGVQLTTALIDSQNWIAGLEVAGLEVLSNDQAKRLFAGLPQEVMLHRERALAVHRLSTAQESLVLIGEAYGNDALREVRQLMLADFSYDFTDKDGVVRKGITQSELVEYMMSTDPGERKRAAIASLQKHEGCEDKLFIIYQNVVKSWVAMGKIRGYPSSRSMRTSEYWVSGTAVDTMLAVVRNNTGIFREYFRMLAEHLNFPEFSRFDIYAPWSKTPEKDITYDDAVERVLATFRDFSPRFAQYAQKVIEHAHVDVHPRQAKRDGAFCSTPTNKVMPYVFLNHVGGIRSVQTLAHELGHAVHSQYAMHLPPSVVCAPLPLAETASTTAEMLLFESILNTTSDAQERKALLADKIAGAYATIVRQAYFTIFEERAHEAIVNGASQADISALWLETLREQFGDAVYVPEEYRHEWGRISHMVNVPFYCLSYTFGELLSLALYQRYKEEGQAFVPTIERVLEAGGSCDPQKLLLDIGIDIEDKAFWQKGFDVVKGWVEELKKEG